MPIGEAPGSAGQAAADVGDPVALPANESEARQRYAHALAVAEQTAALVVGWTAANPTLESSRVALSKRDWPSAMRDAEESLARADQALSDHYARLANEELSRTYAYAGLDDAQLLQLRAAEEIMVTGNSRLAYGRLRTLNQQLAKRTKLYTVAAGDSLWIIAARPEVYANPLLWPLIWQTNATLIPDPNRLRRGQVLKLRAHPSADEIARAVQFARAETRRAKGLTPQIGQIQEQR